MARVALLDAARSHLLTRATSDFPGSIARAYARIPVAQAGETPVGQAALHGQRITMASAEEIAARCPLVAASRGLTGTSSLLAVPVRVAALAAGLTGADAQHWCEALLAGLTDGQLISDDVVVACPHLRGGHNEVPRP